MNGDEAETEPVAEPEDDTNSEPLDGQEQLFAEDEQEQLVLDIVSASGLILLNDTAGIDGNHRISRSASHKYFIDS